MGRDVAAAEKFAERGHEVYAVAEHRNPSLADISEATNGLFFCIKDICDAEGVADCVEMANPDMFYTNDDNALAAGVVDAVIERNQVSDRRLPLLVPCPDKKSARIEWDKFYLRDILDDFGGKHNPMYRKATCEEELEEGMKYFATNEIDVVVKPRGLTGGKGVKVMGPHLSSHEEALSYGHEVLEDPAQNGLVLEEAMKGREFTIMAYSDGKKMAFAPPTYDYPYREDGDKGPGTGGMGSFTMPAGRQLPFLSKGDFSEALNVMLQVQNKLRHDQHEFRGTLYGSFFVTDKGLRVTEFNARGGDPEMMNVINLLQDDVDLAEVLAAIAKGELTPDQVRFKPLASAALYLVSPDYAYDRDSDPYHFNMDKAAIRGNGCKPYLVAAERDDSSGGYKTVGTSRTLAMVALGETPWEARDKIHGAIEDGFEGPLEYRQDIASKDYIDSLKL